MSSMGAVGLGDCLGGHGSSNVGEPSMPSSPCPVLKSSKLTGIGLGQRSSSNLGSGSRASLGPARGCCAGLAEGPEPSSQGAGGLRSTDGGLEVMMTTGGSGDDVGHGCGWLAL
jgi:hypothetical protein